MTSIRILILSFLIPNEFSINLGGFALSGYRVALIALFPYLIWLFFKKRNEIEWAFCDILAASLSLWPTIAFALNTSVPVALESGGILFLEMAAPYFLIRLQVNDYKKRKELAKLFFMMVTILFFLGLPEAIGGRYFTHEFASQITGQSYSTAPEKRFGIWRAIGPTDHSILFGTLCGSALALAIALSFRQKKYWKALLFSSGGVIISASSAPILGALVQLSMLGWAAIFKRHSAKWLLLIGVFAVAYALVDLLSNRDPTRVMFSYLLLNPDTGYARYYMWINSFEVVVQSAWGMWFGYGYDQHIFEVLDPYWRRLMERTVDSFWLVQMLRYGITMLALFCLFLILVFRRSVKHTKNLKEQKDRHLMQAWFISAFALTLIGATVHYWGEILCVYMMIIAACVGKTPRNHRGSSKSANNSQSVDKHVPFSRTKQALA